MNSICIYHSVDLDGWMSAAIVKYWYTLERKGVIYDNPYKGDCSIVAGKEDEESITFLGWNYGNEIPNLSAYDEVVMCDISFPAKEMWKLRSNLGKNLIWIDHHLSAIKENIPTDHKQPVFEGLQDTKFAACELTWKYFFPNKNIPEIVRLLGRYDCFGHKGTDEELRVLEFQYGARAFISGYNTAYQYLVDSINTAEQFKGTIENDIHNAGMSIYLYLRTEAMQTYKRAFPLYLELKTPIEYIEELAASSSDINIMTYKFVCINKERFNPINFGIDYHKDGYDGVACFWYANGLWNFSLYNDNGEVDCSLIAKQFNGGGHKGASGFTVTDLKEVF